MSDTDLHKNVSFDAIEPAPHIRRVRRLVTAVDKDGLSYIAEDRNSPHVKVVANTPSFAVTELWRSNAIPVDNKGPIDDGLSVIELTPPNNGVVFRYVEFPPDTDWLNNPSAPDSQVHTTASIDFAIVISGEIYAVLDKDESLMREGDVLIQRGTRHSWSNRGDKPVVMAFALISGTTA